MKVNSLNDYSGTLTLSEFNGDCLFLPPICIRFIFITLGHFSHRNDNTSSFNDWTQDTSSFEIQHRASSFAAHLQYCSFANCTCYLKLYSSTWTCKVFVPGHWFYGLTLILCVMGWLTCDNNMTVSLWLDFCIPYNGGVVWIRIMIELVGSKTRPLSLLVPSKHTLTANRAFLSYWKNCFVSSLIEWIFENIYSDSIFYSSSPFLWCVCVHLGSDLRFRTRFAGLGVIKKRKYVYQICVDPISELQRCWRSQLVCQVTASGSGCPRCRTAHSKVARVFVLRGRGRRQRKTLLWSQRLRGWWYPLTKIDNIQIRGSWAST